MNGNFRPRQNRINAIAEALNIDPVWLMGYDIEPPSYQFDITDAEYTIIRIYRSNDELRRKIDSLIENFWDSISDSDADI